MHVYCVSVFTTTKGWALGKIRRNSEGESTSQDKQEYQTGWFPTTHIKELSVELSSSRRHSKSKDEIDQDQRKLQPPVMIAELNPPEELVKTLEKSEHQLKEAELTVPVLCDACLSTIWGTGKQVQVAAFSPYDHVQAFMCKECKKVIHKKCSDRFIVSCTPVPVTPETPKKTGSKNSKSRVS